MEEVQMGYVIETKLSMLKCDFMLIDCGTVLFHSLLL